MGDQVLVLLPIVGKKLGVWFEGPMLKQVGPCNYEVGTLERRVKSHLCKVNLLKRYEGWFQWHSSWFIWSHPRQFVLLHLVESFPGIFKDTLGLTDLVAYYVDPGVAAPIKQHPYFLNLQKRAMVCQELEYMVEISAIEQGVHESSPVVLVAKESDSSRVFLSK